MLFDSVVFVGRGRFYIFAQILSRNKAMKTISVQELKQHIDRGDDFTLIDVREQVEYDMGNIGGILIPTSELEQRFAEIPTTQKTIIMCRSGQRSSNVIAWLEQNHAYNNLYNLEGGILKWTQEIDDSLDVE